MIAKVMPVAKLARLAAHAEYGAVKVGSLTRNDLSHAGDWNGTFDELKASIQAEGVLKPLRVYHAENGEKWLLNGHHRAVAAIELGLVSIPVEIETD